MYPGEDHITNGDLPRVGDKIAARRMQLAGHCYRPAAGARDIQSCALGTNPRRWGRQMSSYTGVLQKLDTGVESTGELGRPHAEIEVLGKGILGALLWVNDG